MDKAAIKHFNNINKNRELIFAAEKHIWQNPETGFREWNTSRYLAEAFEELGYELVMAGDIPGFYTDLDTGRPGPKVLIMGELDALICDNHPSANPETHAVHACGHHAQCAALLGIAAALKEPGAMDGLCGSVRLMAVPAEEMIESGYRDMLIEKGIVHYPVGKPEFIYRGYMDEADIAILVHTSFVGINHFYANKGCNGSLVKKASFEGIATHAAFSPDKGINALYAATQAISAINALRETFTEEDCVRVHPIITKGGDTASTIPDEVNIETGVRGATVDSIRNINKKVNRAISGSAASMGANVVIKDYPGYLPLNNDRNLLDIAEKAMKMVVPPENVLVNRNDWDKCSTDMGDVSSIMPTIHPHCGGAFGNSHGNDYRIIDVESACVNSAKYQLMMIDLLLRDQAAFAKKVLAEKQPVFSSTAEYVKAVDKLTFNKQTVFYNDDNTITLNFIK